MNPDQIILSGSLLLAVPLAALAGLVSFLSPCVLPLVPGYLGFVSGMVGGGKAAADQPGQAPALLQPAGKSRVLLGTLFFILGFSAVFVSYGSLFGALGSLIYGRNGQIVQQVLGVVVAALGLVMMGQFAWLQRTVKPSWAPRAGLIGAPILGIAFALGWTPCIGPTLSAVLSLAASSGSALRGSVLALAYSLGLGLPFLAMAAGLGWASKSVNFVRKNIRIFNLIGGGILVVLGLLMATGIWNLLIAQIQEAIVGYLPAF